MTYDDINKLLKSELSAIETYRQALEKKDTDPEQVAAIDELCAILDDLLGDHQRAASRIEAAIRQKGGEPAQSFRQKGGEPAQSSSAWGAVWAKKTGTRRAAQDAAGGWSVFRDAIVDEPPAVQIERIRAGAEPSFLVGAAEALGVSRETIFRVAGLSVSTANRKIAKQEPLDPLVTERLARLAVIEKQTDDAFGDPEAARAWLRAENIGLGGCTPLSMLDTDIGSREVTKILVAIAHGGVA